MLEKIKIFERLPCKFNIFNIKNVYFLGLYFPAFKTKFFFDQNYLEDGWSETVVPQVIGSNLVILHPFVKADHYNWVY